MCFIYDKRLHLPPKEPSHIQDTHIKKKVTLQLYICTSLTIRATIITHTIHYLHTVQNTSFKKRIHRTCCEWQDTVTLDQEALLMQYSLHTRHRSHTHRLCAHSLGTLICKEKTHKSSFLTLHHNLKCGKMQNKATVQIDGPPDLEQSPASFSLIAQTSHHAVFRASFPNVDKCYQIRHNGSNSSMVCQSVLIIQ